MSEQRTVNLPLFSMKCVAKLARQNHDRIGEALYLNIADAVGRALVFSEVDDATRALAAFEDFTRLAKELEAALLAVAGRGEG